MKNSIFFSLLIGIFSFTLNTQAQDCFGTNFSFPAVTEILCSGDTPQLPELGVDYNLTGDLSTQVAGIVWYVGINPDTDAVYTTAPVDQVGCDAGPVTSVYAFAQCDDGTNLFWIQVASHSFQVYPKPQVPVLVGPTVGINDGFCEYEIIPACPNDVFSTTSFTVLPGSPAGMQTVTVESSIGVCPAVAFDMAYAPCPLGCPTTINNPISANLTLCEGSIIDLLDIQNSVSTDFNLGAVYTWTDQNGDEVNPPFDSISAMHTGTCQVETTTYNLTIDCVNDPALDLMGGTVTVNVYPTVVASMYELPDPETCMVEITDLCTDGSLEILYSLTGEIYSPVPPNPPGPGETLSIIYSVNIYDAPIGCGTIVGLTVNGCSSTDCFPSTSFNTLVSCDLSGTSTVDTLTNAGGCDSIAYITYIPGSTTDSIMLDTCSVSALPNSNMIFTSQAGCDSFVVVQYNIQEPSIWYADPDGNGLGYFSMDSVACEQPEGYAADYAISIGLLSTNQSNAIINCYPNPNKGAFSIQLPNVDTESIQVYNQLGKRVAFDMETAANVTQFELLDSKAGVYFVNFLTSNKKRYFLKVLVVK